MTADHAPYLAAVQDALIQAGFETLNEHAMDQDPRGGGIQLDTHSPIAADWFTGWDEVWLAWTEDRGWSLVCQQAREDHPVDPYRFVFPLPLARIAGPAAVARMLAATAGAEIDLTDEHPDVHFPAHTFEDENPAFEAALARYAEAWA